MEGNKDNGSAAVEPVPVDYVTEDDKTKRPDEPSQMQEGKSQVEIVVKALGSQHEKEIGRLDLQHQKEVERLGTLHQKEVDKYEAKIEKVKGKYKVEISKLKTENLELRVKVESIVMSGKKAIEESGS